VIGEFLAQFTDVSGEVVLLTKIEIQGELWPRLHDPEHGELTNDYSVTLHQVILRKKQLELLQERLRAWLNVPFEISIELAMANGDDQSLEFSLGVIDSLISSVGRPACTIQYRSGSFSTGMWNFVVDQSCIGILLDELHNALTQVCAEKVPDAN
jgi:hypothetical protein